MRIATWNVNGIRAREQEVGAFVREHRPDVVCLQEIKATAEQVPDSLRELEGYHCYWHGMKGYSGVALHVRRDVTAERPAFVHPPFDHECRIVTALLAGTWLASVYVPNGGKDFEAKVRFLEALENYARGLREQGASVVICGDMNVTRTELDVHPRERKANVIGQRPDERALFERVLSHGLSDVGRRLEPDNDRLFTWWAPWRNMRQRDIGWRLDYVCASDAVAQRASGCQALREFGTSDHAPVVATFDT